MQKSTKTLKNQKLILIQYEKSSLAKDEEEEKEGTGRKMSLWRNKQRTTTRKDSAIQPVEARRLR